MCGERAAGGVNVLAAAVTPNDGGGDHNKPKQRRLPLHGSVFRRDLTVR